MKTEKKLKMKRTGKTLLAFIVLLGATTYLMLNETSTASESSGQPLLAEFTGDAVDGKINTGVRVQDQGDADFEGKVPYRITFDSKEFVGPMESYTWNFGDGEMAQGTVASHTFLSAGTYSVTLTAKQKTGQIHEEKVTVLVAPKQ